MFFIHSIESWVEAIVFAIAMPRSEPTRTSPTRRFVSPRHNLTLCMEAVLMALLCSVVRQDELRNLVVDCSIPSVGSFVR